MAIELPFESVIDVVHINTGLYTACISDSDSYIGIVTRVEAELNLK